MPVLHNKVSSVSDGSDPSLVRPSDWNDYHVVNVDLASEVFGILPVGHISGLTTTQFASPNISQWTNDAGYLTASSGQPLTKTDDTNVTLTLGGSPATALVNPASITLGWTGTLAASRLNSNVVQGVTNDTNVTGSVSAQNLTLGWTGQLSVARGGTGTGTTFTQGSVVFAGVGGVYSQDNSNLFWDDANNRLGIGTSTPLYSLNFITGDTDAATHRPLVAFSNTVNPKYTAGIASDHQTGIGQRLHIIVGESISNSDPLTGLPRVTVRGDGYVGINNSSPGSLLHIKDGAANDQLFVESGFPTGSASIKTIGTARSHTFGTTGGSNGAGANLFFIYDVTAAAMRMTIDTSGVSDFRGQLISRHGGGSGTYGLSQTPSLILGTSGSLAGCIKLWSPDSGRFSLFQTTNGNLHIDCHSGAFATYLNYYAGTGGVQFGNGASGVVATVSSAGYVTVAGTNGAAKLSIGGGTISDTNVPAQMSAGGATAYYGVNRTNGNYGALFGWDTTYGGVTIRSVNASDNIAFVVNNGTNAGVFKPGGQFVFGGNLTLTSDTFTHFQLGAIGTTKGLAIGQSNSFIRLREVAVANQMCLSTNWNLSAGAQDSGSYPSWFMYMGNDIWRIDRTPAGSTTAAKLFEVNTTRSLCGDLAVGCIDSVSNINTGSPLNIVVTSGDTGPVSTIFGATGVNNNNLFVTRHARGTQTAPTATQNGDALGGLLAMGYHSGGFSVGGYISVIATENWAPGDNGAKMILATTLQTTGDTNQGIVITEKQSVIVGGSYGGALATNATDGFLYIPTCAGTPTGTPTTQTGYAPMVWDSTNKKLYVYAAGWNAMN